MLLFYAVSLLLPYFTVTSQASPIEKRQAVAQVINTCNNPKQVALTFDDGPYIYTTDIVNTLNSNGAKGTFFVNGNNWACIYDTDRVQSIRNAYAAGHQISSHTWFHKDLATLTLTQINDEMWRVEQALTKILGVNPAMMRPPYGSYNNLVRQVSASRNQTMIIWDLDSGDSVGAPPSESKRRYDQAIASHANNILTLNHETYASTAHDVLPYAIQQLKAAGYQLVTVSECTGLPAYQFVNPPQTPDSSWHC